jgi:periplasmic protein CpxP/Spy
MNRFHSVTAVAIVELLLVTGVAFAQGPRGGHGRGLGAAELGLPIRELNLTEAQQQQIRDIRERHRSETEAARKQLATAVEVQRKAVEAIPVDESLIQSTTQGLAQAQTELAIQHARVRSEIWATLTAAQREQAKKLQAERQARMEQRRQQIQQRRQRG